MTGDFKIEYPTWGDLAREQVRRHGLPYFGDVQVQDRSSTGATPAEHETGLRSLMRERLDADTRASRPPNSVLSHSAGDRLSMRSVKVSSPGPANQHALRARHSTRFTIVRTTTRMAPTAPTMPMKTRRRRAFMRVSAT